MSKLLNTLTMSLDYVENEIINVTKNHGKRVAVLNESNMGHLVINDYVISLNVK